MTTNPLLFTPDLAPLETIKSPELIQNAFVVVPLCKWKLEPALRRLGKRFHHRHNAFPEFVKMLDDVSLTFFAVEVEHSSQLNSIRVCSMFTGRCRFQFRINRLLIAWKIRGRTDSWEMEVSIIYRYYALFVSKVVKTIKGVWNDFFIVRIILHSEMFRNWRISQ